MLLFLRWGYPTLLHFFCTTASWGVSVACNVPTNRFPGSRTRPLGKRPEAVPRRASSPTPSSQGQSADPSFHPPRLTKSPVEPPLPSRILGMSPHHLTCVRQQSLAAPKRVLSMPAFCRPWDIDPFFLLPKRPCRCQASSTSVARHA